MQTIRTWPKQDSKHGAPRTLDIAIEKEAAGRVPPVAREDEEARVFVRQHPDSVGNVNSPLAPVFELGSFVGALTELAITAESCRARPRMVTQMRKKDTAQLDPGNLFFDSESRAVQAGADHDDNAHQARALQFQQSMCDMINRLQTRQPKPDHDLHSFGGQGRMHNAGKAPYAPPEVPPSLFTVPKVAQRPKRPNAQTPKRPNAQTPKRRLVPFVSRRHPCLAGPSARP